MFTWHRLAGGLMGPKDSLQACGYEIARMTQRVDGAWLAITRRNLPHELQHTHECQSFDSGVAGCEEWAERHREALLAWGEDQHRQWVARQRWRSA
ncbi:hypothetical protein WCE39_07890 [Luteimonas sp. MJ174]|uniref:hypothetical protein n=1 Tax=Luteimonas sp. MJ174 TaxID=3129237 RepID=UPI0031B9D859